MHGDAAQFRERIAHGQYVFENDRNLVMLCCPGPRFEGMTTSMIHIWAPSESTDPVRYGDMLKLAEFEGLPTFMRANGITDADIMPPYPHGTYQPDDEDQFEVL